MRYPELKIRKFHFLVTGGAGFIGSNLIFKLLENGQRVTAIDNFITGKRKNIEDIERFVKENNMTEEDFRFIEGDIRDTELCMNSTAGVDYILHNAAMGSVTRSVEDPVVTTDINVVGTVNMLHASLGRKVKRFIYASSSSVYGDSGGLPKKEGEEGWPLSPYAASKVSCELFAGTFHDVYGLPVIGLRYFNVFGPRQDASSPYAAVVPIFIKKLLSGEPPLINGDGDTTRDFTYVDNVVDANIRAAFAPKEALGKAYNIACGREVTLNELYGKIASLLNKDIKPVYGPERKGDIRKSFADVSRAKESLKYIPSVDFEKGLELSIDWYGKNL
ncbi:MAG: SDR family oxidoreductase [Deltaproteobacteria bacterium]|nr:SDR family oxidoreductase [Deltaproteobacteria bacterium]